MKTPLTTQRTLLRPFEATDAAESFAWFGDVEVMRYIPLGPDRTVEDTSARLARYMAHQAQHGFSKWVIVDRDTGGLIGDSGFYFLPDGKRVELGYRLARAHWGRGIATEVGLRWIEVAREFIPELPVLHAFAHPENTTSLHIIRKLGFLYRRQETFYGWEVPMHELRLDANGSAPAPLLPRADP